MKIYFNASDTPSDTSDHVYQKIISYLHTHHHEVYEKILGEHIPPLSKIDQHYIHSWFKQWNTYISECDVAIIEGSHPSSVHIGFEIGTILSRNKPVILLYRKDHDPVFIHSLFSGKLIKSEYTNESIEDVLSWCLDELKHIINRRFTFFVSPDIDKYLDTISRKDDTTRSEYIRELIEQDMQSHHQ